MCSKKSYVQLRNNEIFVVAWITNECSPIEGGIVAATPPRKVVELIPSKGTIAGC